MRIIAGERRGHRLAGPEDKWTRPTSDLVREAIFNILGETVVGRPVLDLFAGTGALGLEALSRGAQRATFVEIRAQNLRVIRENLAVLRYEDKATIVRADAFRWVRGAQAIRDDGPLVVFIDPPYRESENHPGRFVRFLESLVQSLAPGSTLVVESATPAKADVLPDRSLWDLRRYGGTQVAIRTIAAEPSQTDPDPSVEPEVPHG